MEKTRFKAVVLLLVSLLLFSGSALAQIAWSIDALEEPYSLTNVSDSTETVKIINITDSDGEPVNQTQLDSSDLELTRHYNITHGDATAMQYLHTGYYTTVLETNSSEGNGIKYMLEHGDDGIEDEENETEHMNFGNMTVELLTDFTEPVRAGSDREIEVNVTGPEGEPEGNAEVDVYFTNITDTTEEEGIRNYDSEDSFYFNSRVGMPTQDNSTYIMHVTASNSSLEYDSPYGSQSLIIETYPSIEGHLQYLNTTSGCNNESFFTQCQRDAEIETGYNITASEAQNVNLTLLFQDRETGEWENQTEIMMEENESFYEAQLQIPDLNSSRYEKQVQLMYNATNPPREEIERYYIDYETFTLEDKSPPKTQSGTYMVRLDISKPFTVEPENISRLNGEVNITNSTEGQVTNFSISDMELSDEGLYVYEAEMPYSLESGEYTVSGYIEDIYGENSTWTSSFMLEAVDQTFDVNYSLETSVNRTGIYSHNITLESMVDELNLSTDITGDIAEFTEINDTEYINFSTDTYDVETVFNISYVDSYSGEITFVDNDTGYNRTVDIDISATSCSLRNQTLCALTSGMEASVDENSTFEEKSFSLLYYGSEEGEEMITTEITGNITDRLNIDPSGTVLNHVNDTETFDLNFTSETSGIYTGDIRVQTVNGSLTLDIPVTLNSTIEPQDASILPPSSINLGTLAEGDDVSVDIDLENTGSVDIDQAVLSSDDYSIEADTVSLEPGETRAVTIEFTGVEAGSGTVDVEATTEFETLSRTIDVEADMVRDYEELADELLDRAIDLDSRASGPLVQDVQNLQNYDIPEIKTAYREGDYERAEELYNAADQELERIDSEIAQGETGGEEGGTETGGETDTTTETSGGIGGLLPFIAGLFVLLLIGFVGYTSIIPEEGDLS